MQRLLSWEMVYTNICYPVLFCFSGWYPTACSLPTVADKSKVLGCSTIFETKGHHPLNGVLSFLLKMCRIGLNSKI